MTDCMPRAHRSAEKLTSKLLWDTSTGAVLYMKTDLETEPVNRVSSAFPVSRGNIALVLGAIQALGRHLANQNC